MERPGTDNIEVEAKCYIIPLLPLQRSRSSYGILRLPACGLRVVDYEPPCERLPHAPTASVELRYDLYGRDEPPGEAARVHALAAAAEMGESEGDLARPCARDGLAGSGSWRLGETEAGSHWFGADDGGGGDVDVGHVRSGHFHGLASQRV